MITAARTKRRTQSHQNSRGGAVGLSTVTFRTTVEDSLQPRDALNAKACGPFATCVVSNVWFHVPSAPATTLALTTPSMRISTEAATVAVPHKVVTPVSVAPGAGACTVSVIAGGIAVIR